MKLSIGMIVEDLPDLSPVCDFKKYDSRLNLERCVFYDGELTLQGNTIYLFSEEMLEYYSLISLSAEEGAALIFLGETECPEKLKVSFVQIPEEKISFINLSNRIHKCLDRYRRIGETLKEIAHTTCDIKKMVKLATPLFHNELTVRDHSFRYVAQSYKKLKFETT